MSKIRMRMMPGIMMPAIVTAMMKKARLSPTKGLVEEMVTVGTLEPDMIRRWRSLRRNGGRLLVEIHQLL